MTLARRRGVNPLSDKRIAQIAERAAVRIFVFERDRGCVLARHGRSTGPSGPCDQLRTAHHLVKASQGGVYAAVNLVEACSLHNAWVEDHPDLAHAWGLVVRRGEWVGSAWVRLQLHGLVDHWWDGSPADNPMPDTV